MAGPTPSPLPDTQVRDDFLASRAAAPSAQVDAEWEKLLQGTGAGGPSAGQAPAAPSGAGDSGGAGGADASRAAAPDQAAPPAVQQSGLPIGLQIEQAAADAPGSDTGPQPGVVERMGSALADWWQRGTAQTAEQNQRLAQMADEVAQGKRSLGDPELVQAALDRFQGFAFPGEILGGTSGAKDVLADELLGKGGADPLAGTGDASSSAPGAPPKPAMAGSATTGNGEAAAGEKPATPPPFSFVTEGAAPTIRVTPEIRQNALDWIEGKTTVNPVQASLGQIADPSVMDHAIQGVARALPAAEVVPDDVVRQAAFTIAMQPEDIVAAGMPKLTGALPDATQIAAHAMLVNNGAEQLGKLWQTAIETSKPEDIEAAVRAYALQSKIVGDWQNAGNEMGRAFRMRQIAQQSRSDYADAVNRIVQSVGMDNIEDAGRKIASLQTPQQVSGLVGAMRWMGSRDGLLYGWYNMLLGPKTVAKKLLTDVTMPVWNLAERSTAERFGSGAVPAGETAQLLSGYAGAFGDALRAGGRGLMAGRSQFMQDFSTLEGLQRTRTSILANGGEIAGDGASIAQPTRNALAYLRAALPTSWIAGIDDFAKTFHYRAELRALAYRDGVSQGLDGAELGSHVNTQIANPSPAIHSQALDAAQRLTFTEPLTGLAQHLADAADNFNIPVGNTRYEIPAGRILLPFARTPANFVRFMYRSSPLPLAFPSGAMKATMAAGGAGRDLALAQIGLGTGTIMATSALALGNIITGNGPTDPRLRSAWLAAGNQPYSIQFPGARPIQYQPEPFAMMMGGIADTIGLGKFAREEDADSAALSLALGVGHVFLSRTYMQGLSDFLDAVQNPDRDGQRYADRLAASLAVPRAVGDVAGAIDGWQRAHYGLLDAIEARIPFLSKNLPPLRDTWGRPIPLQDAYLPPFTGSGFAHVVSPIEEGPASAEPIDQWRWAHRQDFYNGDAGIQRPNRTLSFQQGQGVKANVQLTPQQYDRYQELAGHALQDPRSKLGLLDTLNGLATGKGPDYLQREWDQSSDAERALMVQSLVSKYRSAAKQQLVREFPDIGQAAQAQWGQRRSQLMSATPGAAPSNSNGPTLPTSPSAGAATRTAPSME